MTDREIINITDLAKQLGYRSKTSIYTLLNKDPSFPKPFEIGMKNLWFQDEIDVWKTNRIENAAKTRKTYAGGGSYG